MDQNNCPDGTYRYQAREAVGVFTHPDALEAAVDELEISGFDRAAAISVLASDETIMERVGRLYRTVGEIEDNRQVPRAAFVSMDSLAEGEAAAVGIPFYIGGCAGAGAAVAFGGAWAATIAATVAGGAAGAGLGALLAGAIARRGKDHVVEQLGQGGMVLWVSLWDEAAERRVLQILARAGARDVHVHEIEREWTLKDRPLSEVQFDPFLWWPGDPGSPLRGLDS
jgi:hypothetical protein